MKQGWLMLTAVAGLGLLTACSRTEPTAEWKPGEPLNITSEAQFAERVEGSTGVVLVDFWATWCPPCKKMNPILADLAQDYTGRLVVAKVDVDRNPALADRFKVENIPTLMVFKDGKAVDMHVGDWPKDALIKWVDGYLSAVP